MFKYIIIWGLLTIINEAHIEIHRKTIHGNSKEIITNRLGKYGIVIRKIGNIKIKQGEYIIFIPTNNQKIHNSLLKMDRILNSFKSILEQGKLTLKTGRIKSIKFWNKMLGQISGNFGRKFQEEVKVTNEEIQMLGENITVDKIINLPSYEDTIKYILHGLDKLTGGEDKPLEQQILERNPILLRTYIELHTSRVIKGVKKYVKETYMKYIRDINNTKQKITTEIEKTIEQFKKKIVMNKGTIYLENKEYIFEISKTSPFAIIYLENTYVKQIENYTKQILKMIKDILHSIVNIQRKENKGTEYIQVIEIDHNLKKLTTVGLQEIVEIRSNIEDIIYKLQHTDTLSPQFISEKVLQKLTLKIIETLPWDLTLPNITDG
ncbi:MAG: hypothetical protein HRU29_16445, partial [Rhizobiales bacterium]|nr:hypothetical protein [Hyphomicrobiales bacterium]